MHRRAHRRRSLPIAPTRLMALLVVAAVVSAMTFYMRQAQAVITTPFTATFSANANGSILLRGNSNLTCPVSATGCIDALNGVGTPATVLNNNSYNMVYADVDGDSSTFNSSTAQLTMPTGSRVLFAALYWSANTAAGTNGATPPNASLYDRVKLAVPGGSGYTTVTAGKTPYVSGTAYQGYADVTSMVAGAGNGTYGVADIQAATGQDRYAGWALVVAYQNPAENMRNLRVYDGFGVVSSSSTSVNIAVSNFQTPQSGTVTTKIGTVVYEGDLGLTGDTLQLNGTSMSDAANPATNFFNSTVSDGGSLVGGRNPGNPNLMGVDVDQFDATGRLANNATSATLTLTTGGETFYPGVVTFTTDLYAPNLTATMTGTDTDGGDLLPGDTIDYTVDVKNDGTDTASESVLSDAIPAGTTYVPGSMKIAGVARTDATVDDTADFTSNSTVFRLGTLADASTGGELAPNGTTRVTFQVRVNPDALPNTVITNVANVTYTGKNTGRHIAGTSSAAPVTVNRSHADLAATVTVLPTVVQRDSTNDPVTYSMTVTNNGPEPEPAARAVLALPAGISPGTLPAGCTAVVRTVTCDLGPLSSGTGATRVIPAVADASAASAAHATATASGAGLDGVPSNDSAVATLAVNTAPTATGDAASTANATPVVIDVLANDSDPDGPQQNVSVTAQPAHGGAVANLDGTITYTPDPQYAGTDTFTYQLDDGHGASATASVSVTVANGPPVAHADQGAGAAGQDVLVPVLANDTDPNGDPLTIASVVQPSAGGAVTVVGNQVKFSPTVGFGGNATFSYTVSDGHGGTDTASVTVAIANSRPVAVDDTATTPYRTDKVINVLGNDSDPNNDHLTVVSVTQPSASHGTVDLTGGVVTFHPAAGFSGTATFTYTITDGTDTATATVQVNVDDAPPTAIDRTVSGPYGTAQVIDVVAAASDPNGDALRVLGMTTPGHGTAALNPSGKIVYTPDPHFSGTDDWSYTITDDRGGQSTAQIHLTVLNGVPVVQPDAVTAEANVPLDVHVLANDSDPNLDVLTVTVDTQPTHGTAAVGPGGVVTYTPAPGYHGPDAFHYTVTDGHGGTGGAAVTVAVVNSPPTARNDAYTTATNTPATLTVLDNDTDPNGDPLTILSHTSGGSGTVTQGVGNLTYTPDAGFWGTDSFTYVIQDAAGNTATAVVTMTVDNADPIAVPDAFPVQPSVANLLDVLANDTDPNTGQHLKVVAVGTPHHGVAIVQPGGAKVSYIPTNGWTGFERFDYVIADDLGATSTSTVTVTVNAPPVAGDDTATTPTGTAVSVAVLPNDSDPEHTVLTVVSATAGAHGTTHVNGDNTITYTPAAGFAGADTFSYTVRDTAGGSTTATVTVTVANAVPVANADPAAAPENGRTDIAVLANDTDANTSQTLTVTSVGSPAHGTAVRLSNGKVRYTPDAGFTGTDTFTYVVDDGHGGTATGTVTVTVSGAAPVALPDSQSTPYQHGVTIHPLANDMDPNHDTLTITGTTQPDHGSVTITAGALRYEPPAGWSGTTTFTYTIDDGHGGTADAIVTVTVGTPPAVPDKHAAAQPGAPVAVKLPTVDEHNRPVTVVSVGTPSHGTARLNANGQVIYTPAKGFSGTDTFTYRVQDANGNFAIASITITVAGANHAPTARNDGSSVTAGRSVVVNPVANDKDQDGDKLKVVKIGRPRHGTAVLNANGTVTYAPAKGYRGGVDSFPYTISDGKGHTATATITITVNADGSTDPTVKLPKTGTDVMTVVGAGLLTLLVGGVLYWVGMTRGGTPALILAGVRESGPGRHRPGRHSAGYNSRWA